MKLNAKWSQNRIVLNLGYLNLRFVSDLGFRASDFNKKQGFTVPNRAVVNKDVRCFAWLPKRHE